MIAGVLDHDLSIKRLMKVNRTYERINMVPEGYHQAELFLQKEEPRHLEWLEERIANHHKNKRQQNRDNIDELHKNISE